MEDYEQSQSDDIAYTEETGTRTGGSFNDGNLVRDTNDDVFATEFNVMMTYRKTHGGETNPEFSIPAIKVPNLPTLLKVDHKGLFASVLNIQEPYYNKLNNNLVEVIKDRSFKQRKSLNDGSFRKDENGNIAYFDFKVDSDSYIVRTPINIRKSNYERNEDGSIKTDRRGSKVRYYDPSGFAFIDYEDDEETKIRYFYYSVPKKYLYKANMNALVLSTTAHRSSYYGYKLAFVNGLYYYLCVINYKREQNDNTTRVLGVANKVDFKAEIQEILSYWQGIGKYKDTKPIMFNSVLTEIPYASGKLARNLGCMYFRGKFAVETYEARSTEPFGEIDESGEQDG